MLECGRKAYLSVLQRRGSPFFQRQFSNSVHRRYAAPRLSIPMGEFPCDVIRYLRSLSPRVDSHLEPGQEFLYYSPYW